jgi:hypothetical protein
MVVVLLKYAIFVGAIYDDHNVKSLALVSRQIYRIYRFFGHSLITKMENKYEASYSIESEQSEFET